MKQSRFTVKIILSILLAISMLALFGCAKRTVLALDYSLEDELYADETETNLSGDPTPAPETAADAPVEQTAETPTPAELSATPTPQQTDESSIS